MNLNEHEDLSSLSMQEIFRVEAETQTGLLNSGLLELESGSPAPQLLESLMRAAHSMKGAARIVNLATAVTVAHAMEDCFVAAQKGRLTLGRNETDALLRGVDLLAKLSKLEESNVVAWEIEHAAEIKSVLAALNDVMAGKAGSAESRVQSPESRVETPDPRPQTPSPALSAATTRDSGLGTRDSLTPSAPERVLRLTAENLNRLLGLAGESLVESRWLRPFSESLQRLKRMQTEFEESLDDLRETLDEQSLDERTKVRVGELFHRNNEARQFLSDRLQELDLFDRRSAHLSHRLYLEVLRARMRPFGDGVKRFPRMVRDLAHSLGKEVHLEILGENTQVDRDILERLETPLAHLLRNAIDHGCESPDARQRAGKPALATIRLEARHSAGQLVIIVADDGAGLDPERVRSAIVEKKLTTESVADKMHESELLEFLFLPGFSLKETVTELSGRGVGLDIVQNLVKSVRGGIRVSTQPGRGMKFQLQLPLTLSVLRTLLVEVSGEPYAIPLAQITRTLKLPREQIESLEGRQHFAFGEHQVGLLTAHQVLDAGEPKSLGDELPVVVLGERGTRHGLIVDKFLGERELVVQPLDPRLGKVKDISAAALMEDGSPVLILDVDDVMTSVSKLISSGALSNVSRLAHGETAKKTKRVLAVDDSLTVRELERKLLSARGYIADVAVDGMDGWNAVRSGSYDLVITDVDMPRMDGIELTTLIKKDPALKSLPVMIVSYKDRDEDRMRGLDAGADYYLTKGSFHDETLLQAVVDLIGEP